MARLKSPHGQKGTAGQRSYPTRLRSRARATRMVRRRVDLPKNSCRSKKIPLPNHSSVETERLPKRAAQADIKQRMFEASPGRRSSPKDDRFPVLAAHYLWRRRLFSFCSAFRWPSRYTHRPQLPFSAKTHTARSRSPPASRRARKPGGRVRSWARPERYLGMLVGVDERHLTSRPLDECGPPSRTRCVVEI